MIVAYCYTQSSVVIRSLARSICLLIIFVSPAKMAEMIKMSFAGPKEPCVRRGSRSPT